MDIGVHGPLPRAYPTPGGMSNGIHRMHSAVPPPPLVQSQAHTSSSYSIQSQLSSRASDTTQGTNASTLFPPPLPTEVQVRPTENVMNRVGDKEQSLFQICVILRQRLKGVPNFDAFLEEEEQGADEDTDPVTLLWRTFRRGYPLLALYNVLRPDKPIQPDLSTISSEVKKGKAMTFKFLNALIGDLKFRIEDCFIIFDLYGDDTTGFVKVTKTVSRMLDILVDRQMIEDTRRDSAEPLDGNKTAVKRSQRQHIVDELVNTERTYVQQLELLQAFQVQCQKTGVIPGDIAHQIFLNLNGLLDFQRRFLIRVEQINSQPEDEQNWGKLFVLYNDAFSIYEPYITNQKQCEETVMREFDKLRMAGGSADIQGIVANPSTLYSFLMKPFQRLAKYPLLLSELYKKGDLDEERKADLLIGKECASAVLSRTNAAMEREDRLAAVQELKSRVEDWKGHRVEGFGELLLFGTFTVIKSDAGPSKDSEREYHVYFFESILLCCKDIDPTKAKNKMKGRPLVDKKGKPKLQLKGRIFMQNVTDVISASKQGSHTCQIFWKGDPGIENFTIRFLTEDQMQKWYNKLLERRTMGYDAASPSESIKASVSATEFTYMESQGQLENPYREEEDEDDVDTLVTPNSYGSYPSSAGTSLWNASSASLRSRSGTGESGPPGMPNGRMVPPRFAPGTLPQQPVLSLQTHSSHGSNSPGPKLAESYFSPITESPMSSRTSASSGMYFPRQQGHYESGHERYTSPLPYRSGSRETMNGQAGYPQNARGPTSRPSFPTGVGMSQPSQANRNRSVSSPNINDAQRRQMNSARPPMPEGPLPSHLQHTNGISRSQTNSPHLSGGIDERLGAPSPHMQRDRSQPRSHPSESPYPPPPSSLRSVTPSAYSMRDPMSPPLSTSTPVLPSDAGAATTPQPTQLKVKVHATAAGQVLTLVVPLNITYMSLKDRIDAKLQRSTNISLSDRGGNQVKLKYLDDDDYVNIGSDEDVQTAFETWREQKGEGLVGMGEIELFCQ